MKNTIRGSAAQLATSFGYSLAMRVLQSDLYPVLDDSERAECDELIRRGQRERVDTSPAPADAALPQVTTPLYASLEHERGGYDLNKLASASTASDAPVVSDARALDLSVATPESPREVP